MLRRVIIILMFAGLLLCATTGCRHIPPVISPGIEQDTFDDPGLRDTEVGD